MLSYVMLYSAHIMLNIMCKICETDCSIRVPKIIKYGETAVLKYQLLVFLRIPI